MSRVVKIEGLDCPNCARALEEELNKIDIVKNVKIDFVKSTLVYDSENEEEAFRKIAQLTKQLEPDVVLTAQGEKRKLKKSFWIDLACLLAGIVVGVICLFVDMPTALFWVLFVTSALLLGYKTYYKAVALLIKGKINENLLLTISVVGAAILKSYMESLMVIALYSIGKIFEGLAVEKSRRSIAKLTNLKPDFATIVENGEEKQVDPKEVQIGSITIVKPGEKVALDGKVISGSASLDMQSLTGESVPVYVEKGSEVLSGSIVLDGVLKIQTTSTSSESTVSKIMDLIENAASKKSKTETLISKITKWYTLGVIICALAVFGIVFAISHNLAESVSRGLIFLVVSCPCAFAISVPLSYFSGIGNAARFGILIKGSNYLDACSKLNLVAFDKTGTLTTGQFSIEKVVSKNKEYRKKDIIFLASIGEQNSLHPLAKSIVASCDVDLPEATRVKEVAGEGVYFNYNKDKYFVGRKTKELKNTVVELFKNEEKIGEIHLVDEIKDTAKDAVSALNTMNVKTVMLSGDNEASVKKVVKEIGLAEGYSNLLPEDKFNWIRQQKENNKTFLGYVGDGINDSPSLMLADVGISMGINGSAASIEASDIVLVNDNPAKVATAVKISKYTQKIVWENIILSAAVKFTVLALGTFGITGMLTAVFADVGVTLLAILNSMRALAYSPDKKKK